MNPPRRRSFEDLLGARGFGCLFRPTYRDRHGEKKTSAIWWLRWGHEGERFQESTHTSDHAKAEAFRRAKFKEIWGGRMPWEPAEEPTLDRILGMVVTNYETRGLRSVYMVHRAKKHLLAHFDPKKGRHQTKAADVVESRIVEYVQARQAAGAANATINRELAALRRAFNLAHRFKDRYGNPLLPRVPSIELLEEAAPREGWAEEGEAQAIELHLAAPLPDMIEFLRLTGMRRDEPQTIQWPDVDREAQTIRLSRAADKGKRGRVWPYGGDQRLVDIIERQWARKVATERALSVIVTHVFFRRFKTTWRPIRDFRWAWVEARKKAGLSHRLVHDFRRTFCRDAIRSGMDRKRARQLSGHMTESVFERYNIVETRDLEEAVARKAQQDRARPPVEQRLLPFAERKRGKG